MFLQFSDLFYIKITAWKEDKKSMYCKKFKFPKQSHYMNICGSDKNMKRGESQVEGNKPVSKGTTIFIAVFTSICHSLIMSILS